MKNDTIYKSNKENTQNENTYCPYACDRRDCDGDWDTYCTKDGSCQYQRNTRDCDGDIISFCRR